MRFALSVPALAATLAVYAAAPADPLAALADASGHAALVHVRATSTRVVEGRTITTTIDRLGAAQLLRQCIAGVCAGSWFDGSRAWTFGLNEVLLPEEPGPATLTMRTLFAIDSYAFAEPAFRSAGGTVVALGAGRWRVRAPEGAELVALVDPASQTVREVDTPLGQPVARFARPVRAGGASFALERRTPFGDLVFDQAGAVGEPLAPPAGAVATFSGEAPVALGGDAVPIVACSVGGHAARCLLDTGAVPSAMTLALADALGLEPHGELEIAGVGRFATGFVETGPLVVGPARFERARFAIVPQTSAARFDLVIGCDLLARVRLRLERGRGVARLLPPRTSPVAGAVQLLFGRGVPMVAVSFGSERAEALLDTGDQAIFSLGYATYRTGPQWPVLGRDQSVGIAGGDDVLTVQVPDVRVGPLALGGTRVAVRRTQTIPHVGIGLWARYDVDLDEAAERVVFSPR